MPSAQRLKRHTRFSRGRTGQGTRKSMETSYIFRYSDVSVDSLIGAKFFERMEARVGIEPTHKGFAVFGSTHKSLRNKGTSAGEVPQKPAYSYPFCAYWQLNGS